MENPQAAAVELPPVQPTRPGKFSAALNIPFGRRTWPSMATAEAAGRLGAWQLAEENDSRRLDAKHCLGSESPDVFSTGVLEEALSTSVSVDVTTASATGLTSLGRIRILREGSAKAPAPPPRGATFSPVGGRAEALPLKEGAALTGGDGAVCPARAKPVDAARLANLFGYTLADYEDIVAQKLHHLEPQYASLATDVEAASAALAASVRADVRRQHLPLREHIRALEDMVALHEAASHFLRRVAAFEEVLVHAVVRDALKAVEPEDAVGADEDGAAEASVSREGPSALLSLSSSRLRVCFASARSFALLELALLQYGRLARAAERCEKEARFHACVEARWSLVKTLLPINEEGYYDLLDIAHSWGPGWSKGQAFAATIDAKGLSEAEKNTASAAATLACAPLYSKVERVLAEQRRRTRTKTWLLCDDLRSLLSSP